MLITRWARQVLAGLLRDGPSTVYADEVTCTVPAGLAGEIHTATAMIVQGDMPTGSIVAGDFANDVLPVAILQRFNNTSGQIDVNLYYFQNVAGGTYPFHVALIRHVGFG